MQRNAVEGYLKLGHAVNVRGLEFFGAFESCSVVEMQVAIS